MIILEILFTIFIGLPIMLFILYLIGSFFTIDTLIVKKKRND